MSVAENYHAITPVLCDGLLSFEQAPIQVKHYFAPGLYAREATMPAGTLGVGAVHVFPHICVISKGYVSVFTDKGRTDIRAPYTYVAEAGVQRTLLAHEETVWTTFHNADVKTVEEAERLLVVSNYPEFKLLSGEKEPACLSS